MENSRIPLFEDEELELKRRKKELHSLKHYPNFERTFTAITKTIMAVLVGGSTVVTLVMLETAVSSIVIVGFAVGAFVYAIKAIRDVRKSRKKEKKLTREYDANCNDLARLLDLDLWIRLVRAVELSNKGMLDEDHTEQLYAHLCDLQQVLTITYPADNQQSTFQSFIKSSIRTVGAKVAAIRGVPAGLICRPYDYGVINFHQRKADEEEHWLVRNAAKAGNRLLSFVGGFSSAVGIGIGIAGFAFNIASPVGWVLGAILLGSVVMGLTSVAIDYYASRREETKIKNLENKNLEIRAFQTGISGIKTSLNNINKNVGDCLSVEERYRGKLEKERESVAAASLKIGQLEVEKDGLYSELLRLQEEKQALALRMQGLYRLRLSSATLPPPITDDTLQNTQFGKVV